MNMKKICYLIVGYAPTPQKEEALVSLLTKIKESGHPILLVMHNMPSPHVIDMVEYFFYDSNNEVTPYYPVKGDWFYPRIYNSINIGNGLQVWSQYSSNLKYHGLAAMSMMFQGLMIAKSLGYEICHMIEYDTEVKSLDEFIENENLLLDAASVYYFLGPTEPMIYCQIASYNLTNYDLQEFNWSTCRERIKEIVNDSSYGINSGMAEVAFYELLHTKKSSIKKQDSSLVQHKIATDLSGKDKLDWEDVVGLTPYINENNHMYVIVHYCEKVKQGKRHAKVIVNNSDEYNLSVELYQEWITQPIGTIEQVKTIDFYIDDKFIKSYDFINDIDKHHFINHSKLEKIS